MKKYTAQEIATVLNGEIEGDIHATISKLAKIEEADTDSISFLANPKYFAFSNTTSAGILIAPQKLAVANPSVKAIIRVADPQAAFVQLLNLYHLQTNGSPKEGIEQPSVINEGVKYDDGFYLGAFSYIGKNVKIGKNVQIYPQVFIGDDCQIGDGTVIYSGVKVYHQTRIGADCVIQSGAVIGSDGFGFLPTANGFQKIPQTGIVEIGSQVEIGANTVIDRATLGKTTIHNGVKLDNLIHIAHNVEIDQHSAIAAQTGISGSTKIGKGVLIGGQVGIIGHIKIGDGVKINAQSGISKNIGNGKSVSGSPATDFREHYKQLAYLKKVPDLIKKIDLLEKQLAETLKKENATPKK